tara:strand:+ start:760 stop:1245 length:486 start_codon:yes stop_codon:yes gene_type:complete
MVFNRKGGGFFLNLEDKPSDQTDVVLSPGESPTAVEPEKVEEGSETSSGTTKENPTSQKPARKTKVSAKTKGAKKTKVAKKTKGATTVAEPAPKNAATGVQTTAEAIAAELAAAENAKPMVVLTTFSPDNLLPGTGLQQRRRRPGASLKSFRTIAADLFKG